MRIFYDDYESDEIVQLTHEQFEKKLGEFDRAISRCDIAARQRYADLNRDIPGVNISDMDGLLDGLDHDRTIVLHLDSDGDLYIEADEQVSTTVLSRTDGEMLEEIIAWDKEPSWALRFAAQRYRRLVESGQLDTGGDRGINLPITGIQ